MAKKSASSVHGKVVAHNISPKGHVEGLLLQTTSGIVQVNFPKHSTEGLARKAKVGATVELAAELEDEDGDHPVYVASDPAGDASGVITRLNYALHGEVNGYHLEDGTFVHVKPDGAKRYKLKVGDRITAHGARRGDGAVTVLEPERVTKLAAPAAARARK